MNNINEFGKWTGPGESVAHVSPMSPVSPIGLVGFFELNQKPGGYLWTLLDGTLTRLNAFLTAFNASVTDFLTHDFQRLTDLTDFNAS
jgi:hypothetical protein